MTDLLRADETTRLALSELVDWWQKRSPDEPAGPVPRGGPPVPFHRGIAKARIVGGATSTGGKVHYVRLGSTGDYTEDTGSTHTAYDIIGPGASSGEEIFLFRHQQSGLLQLFAPPSQRCRGQVTSTYSTNGAAPASFLVDTVEPLWGASPTTSGTATVTVQNVHTWTIYPDALVKFERRNNSTGNEWEAYQIDCE